jgi:hypothetical protein
MDFLTVLREAKAGRAHFARDRFMTKCGNAKYWEMEYLGEEPCEPFVAHGNFNVSSQPIFRSRLTPLGEEALAELEQKEANR